MRAVADKLLDLCESHAEEIAQQWCKYLTISSRTPSYHRIAKEKCIHQAVFLYKNLKQMYFSDNPYEEVVRFLEQSQYVEDIYSRGIPLHEGIYALIMMRREIWVFADFQALFTTMVDMYRTAETINRTILLFDYAVYIVTQKYQEMAKG